MNIQSQEITHSLFIPCTTIPTTITTTNTNARTFTRMSLSHFYCCWGWEFSSPPTEEEQLSIYFLKKITFNPHLIFFIPLINLIFRNRSISDEPFHLGIIISIPSNQKMRPIFTFDLFLHSLINTGCKVEHTDYSVRFT